MKQIQSDALVRLFRIFGITSGSVQSDTELDDGNVSQVIDVNTVIRRSRTLASSTGWFICTFENDHLAAGALAAEIDPYLAGAAALAPFRSPVLRGFDFWVLSATLRRTAGAGTLDGAFLNVQPAAQQRGWGIDDGGAAVDTEDQFALARWTALDASVAGQVYGISGDGSVNVHIGLRIPRAGATLRFHSDVAGAAATIRCYLVCGLFTEGLGQDVAAF